MALPALTLSEQQQQQILNSISLINDKVEVMFMFIGHGLFVHIRYLLSSWVTCGCMLSLFVQHLFSVFW